jgi:micrococcal nuclease
MRIQLGFLEIRISQKKLTSLFLSVFVLVLLLIFQNAGLLPDATKIPPTTPQPTPMVTPTPSGEQTATATSAALLVTRIIDGDTIELENGEKVRYIGIDTPEKTTNDCFNTQATAKNSELVMGKKVSLVKDVSERDRYGRLLRYVYVGDLFVNLELVQQGFAHASTYPPDVKFQAIFQDAQNQAQLHNFGLWGQCP